ncbi:MAG: copper amine oxidase N-terminal domain-containing protein [Clostridiales bacterium]|nr:copper amine oxidase N-terminal domain-containing protein [Clostridiales bacterium]
MKEVIAQRKLIAKNAYTVEELATFEASVESISSDADVAKVLSVGSVSVKKNLIKFDTPPYIKGGRTVVPVRAITEGLGAEVSFNPETFEVTIVKGDTTIILSIGSNVALVNGETVELDSQSEITNSRTYVPIRFIAETFGLTVDWDAETETIDIEESVEEVQEEVQE